MHILKEPSFFHTNRTRAPHGETLSLTNPFSNKSLSCSFNTFNSARAILYGGIEIGWVSGRTSIPKSISLSGGTPGRSSGNTLGNSFTIGTDSREGGSTSSDLTRTR
nr:hypothetical protein [Solanum melongena]WMB97137.1 hypothetical protein [Solanum aethiopicum]